VDAYVFDVLMADLIAHDRQPSAFVLYLSIWRLTDGGRRKSPPISLRSLSEQTGLSKRAIQDAADRLERRQLISIERQMPTAVPVYRLHKPWSARGPREDSESSSAGARASGGGAPRALKKEDKRPRAQRLRAHRLKA
jgi:DNA-binding transcriptional MocR family regulator